MCNLYSVTKGQHAIRALTRAMADLAGNLPSLPEIYPDYRAPIVRTLGGGRALTMARWGMPSPAAALRGRTCDTGVTNVRNTTSPHWRRWLGIENRCVVPFTSFSEHGTRADGSRGAVWFSLDAGYPLACFAGIWTRWTCVRKVKEGETTNDLFAFLTTEPNAVVAAYHPKAMPVILRTGEEIDTWLCGSVPEALRLQRALPDDALMVATPERAVGEVSDQPAHQAGRLL